MKRRQGNAAKARAATAKAQKEQQEKEQQLMPDISVKIKEERIDEEEQEEEYGQTMEVDSFATVKLEPNIDDNDDNNLKIEKVMLPFHTNENFWDENQESNTAEMTNEMSEHLQPKLEPCYSPTLKIEQASMVQIPNEIISMNSASSAAHEMPLDTELKIEVHDAWNYTSTSQLPDVTKSFLPHFFEGNFDHDANESESQHINKNKLKRSKKQPNHKKKLCFESTSAPISQTASKIMPQMKNASTCCPSQVNNDSETESYVNSGGLLESIKNSDCFVCHLCSITFTDLDLFNDHISENHKNYTYCTKCKLFVKTNNKLAIKKHESTCCELVDLRLYSNIGKPKKNTFEKIWYEKDSCEDIQESEHFTCHLCNEHYSNLQDLNEHVAKHHKKYLYCVKCRCLVKVANRIEMSNHEQQCCKLVANKSFVCCNYCVKAFLSVAKMLKHVKAKHSDDKNSEGNISNCKYEYRLVRVYKCSFCLAVYQKETEIRAHVSQQHKQVLYSTIKQALPVYTRQVFIKCMYCRQCFHNLSKIHTHISYKHPGKSNVTEIELGPNNSLANTTVVKLETGTQTHFEDLDLEYYEYIQKLKKMEDFDAQNEKDLDVSKEGKTTDTSLMKKQQNSTEVQTNIISKESLVPILNSCNSFCTMAMNSETVKKLGYNLAVHCSVCSQDILAKLYFSKHLVLCVCLSNSVQCIFCTQQFSIIGKNIFTYLSHIKEHFSDDNLIASQCTNCKLSFFCSFNKTMHEERKKCKKSIVTPKKCNESNVAANANQVSDSVCNETEKALKVIQNSITKITGVLNQGEFLTIHCGSCNKNFGASEYVNFHIKNCSKRGKTVCVFCKQHVSLNILDALKHIISHISKKLVTIPCTRCKAMFLNVYNRDRHLQTHVQTTSYKATNTIMQPSTSVSLLKNPSVRGTKVAVQESLATIIHDKEEYVSNKLISIPDRVWNQKIQNNDTSTATASALPAARTPYILPNDYPKPPLITKIDPSSIHIQNVSQGLRLILPKSSGNQSSIVLATPMTLNPNVKLLLPPKLNVIPKSSSS